MFLSRIQRKCPTKRKRVSTQLDSARRSSIALECPYSSEKGDSSRSRAGRCWSLSYMPNFVTSRNLNIRCWLRSPHPSDEHRRSDGRGSSPGLGGMRGAGTVNLNCSEDLVFSMRICKVVLSEHLISLSQALYRNGLIINATELK